MRSIVNVLGGSGKVIQSAIIPGILECSNHNVLSVTSNDALKGIEKCVLSGMYNTEYPILVQDGYTDTLDNFCNTMEQANVRVGVISSQSILFKEMILNGNGGIWFSACRENLYKVYIPVMEKYITEPTHIYVFDNDENIISKARELCQNSYINFHKCVIHSVCSSSYYDHTAKAVYLENGKECLMIFPPDIPDLKTVFKSNPIWGRAEFKFTTSDEAFRYYKMWKLLGINAIHTLASVKAYINGFKSGMSLTEISNKHFSDLISEEDLLIYVRRVYSLLYEKYLATYAEVLNTPRDIYIMITQNFICGLYNMNETIGRGLDPTHPSFKSKLNQHFPMLRESNDKETLNMLDEFQDSLKLFLPNT